MEAVARHLRDKALEFDGEKAGEDADLFGRSAFNRYYYAAFLITRKKLKPIFVDLPGKHAAIPDFLRGHVARELNRRKRVAMRAEDYASVQAVQNGRNAALKLADLLVQGYSARVVADYHPELAVSFNGQGFLLNEVPVSDAVSWPTLARQFVLAIVNAMRQTDAC